MRFFLIWLLIFNGFLFASDVIVMHPIDPVEEFDDLDLSKYEAKTLKIKKGFSSEIKDLNSIHTLITSDDGFYISGNSLTTDNVSIDFNEQAFINVVSGSGFYSSSTQKEVFSLNSKNILVSILHYSKDGELLWRSDFPNDFLSSSAMVRLKNGTILLALTPVYIEKDREFYSYIFVYSKNGKLISKRKYKNYIINSMIVTPQNKILCGTSKKVGKKYIKTLLLVDSEGFKEKDIDLKSQINDEDIYDILNLITKISDGYFLGDVDSIIKLDDNLEVVGQFYLGPYLDKYSSYFVNFVHEDKDKNIHIIGNYGHKLNVLQKMKFDKLKRLNNPRGIEEQLNPASRTLTKNTALSMAYDEALREMEKYNQERKHGYSGIFTKDSQFLTLIKKDDYGQDKKFFGTSKSGGFMYVEYLENGKNGARQFLFDDNAKLIKSSRYSKLLCDIKCVIQDKNLFYISSDENTSSLKFNKIRLLK